MDKLQEAAAKYCNEKYHPSSMHKQKAFDAFEAGGTYIHEQSKEAIQELVSALEESNLQINYLHDKFSGTVSGSTTVRRNDSLIQKHKQ